MTQPHQPSDQPPAPPAATVLEWGPDHPPDPGGTAARWRDPRVGWVLAGLGAVALFASLTGEWQVTSWPAISDGSTEEVTAGVAATGTWGTGWVVGGMLLATCAALALFGRPALRPYARTAGLALAGVQVGVLAAATIALRDQSAGAYLFGGFDVPLPDYEVALGRGLYAAYAAVALVAAALWLARVPGGAHPGAVPPAAAPPPAGPAPADPEPGELTVGPAEPIAYPDERHEWR